MEQFPSDLNKQNASNIPPAPPVISPVRSAPQAVLAAGGGQKFAMIAVALILLAVFGAGGYYFYTKDKALQPEVSPDIANLTLTPIADKNLDSDKDGLTDVMEKVLGTNAIKADTDSDGFTDLGEIKSGYSPLIVGAAGKYSQEDWNLVKKRIMTEDADFYGKEFEVVAGNFVYPDDYGLKNGEIPAGFHYKPIDDSARAVGIIANPGFFKKDIVGGLMHDLSSNIDPKKVEDIYLSNLIDAAGEKEMGILAIKFNYALPNDFISVMEKMVPREGYIYLRDDKNIMVIVGGDSSSVNSSAINDLANKIQIRLELKRIGDSGSANYKSN